jgi:N-acyl-D-aspartate/D-glutamate deacylase
MHDLLVKNGTIVDGSGEPRYRADIAVKSGTIIAIEPDISVDLSACVLDASGQIITPGFINTHSHSDMSALMGFDAPNVLEQGITTELTGQCGYSFSPLAPSGETDSKDPLLGSSAPPDSFRRIRDKGGGFEAYLEEMSLNRPAVNMAFLVGHGNIRRAVMGDSSGEPDFHEMERMKYILRSALQVGAFGFSTGLIYPPGCYARSRELMELASVLSEYEGALYASHIRNEGDFIEDSVQEALDIGNFATVPVLVSHHKTLGRRNRGKSEKTLQMMEKARENGQSVFVDAYPYTAGSTNLMYALPPRFASEGHVKLLEKLEDPRERTVIKEELMRENSDFENLIAEAGPENVVICDENMREFSGMSLRDIAEQNGQDPIDAAMDLLSRAGGGIGTVFHIANKDDMERILKNPWTMIGTDGRQTATREKYTHPRANASFPKFIGTYCRERGFFPLEECIRRITSLPASSLGLAGKGQIRQGYDADIVIFDFDSINGPAEYGMANTPNTGIHTVVIGGSIVVADGAANGLHSGKILVRHGSI